MTVLTLDFNFTVSTIVPENIWDIYIPVHEKKIKLVFIVELIVLVDLLPRTIMAYL